MAHKACPLWESVTTARKEYTSGYLFLSYSYKFARDEKTSNLHPSSITLTSEIQSNPKFTFLFNRLLWLHLTDLQPRLIPGNQRRPMVFIKFLCGIFTGNALEDCLSYC
jgi:hypothetical protein